MPADRSPYHPWRVRLYASDECTVDRFTQVCTLLGQRLRTPLALACALVMPVGAGAGTRSTQDAPDPQAVTFDPDMLRRRGIALEQLGSLGRAPAFAPGLQQVTLRVNERSRGRHTLRFGDDGQPCADAALIAAAGLDAAKVARLQRAAERSAATEPQCPAFRETLAAAQLDAMPASLSLDLRVPTELLAAPTAMPAGIVTGGTAALFNYHVATQHTVRGDQRSRYLSLNTDLGLNAGDWIVRSRQVHTEQGGITRSAHLDAYAQRNVADHAAVLQLGQIHLRNPTLAGVQVIGVQISNEGALQARPTARVEGLAQSPAQVEVRQQGVLVYATVVDAGRFVLEDVPEPGGSADLEVTVTEADGRVQRFRVPAGMYGVPAIAPGYVLGAGSIRGQGIEAEHDWVLSAGWSGRALYGTQLSSGVLVAREHRSVGMGIAAPPRQNGAVLQGQLAFAQVPRLGRSSGLQARASWSQPINRYGSWSVTSTRQTAGYRPLLEASLRQEHTHRALQQRDQHSVSTQWGTALAGAVSIGYSRTRAFQGASARHSTMSWGRQWGRVSVTASMDWNLSPGLSRGRTMLVTGSVPLGAGTRSLRSHVRQTDSRQQVGVAVTERLHDTLGYRASIQQDPRGGPADWSAGISLLPRYSQLDLGYARYGSGASSISSMWRGGLVWHRDGVTASPYPLGDSFAVLRVGERAGIQIRTPSGKVWTDAAGRAVVAQLPPYANGQVEVVTRSLPRSTELLTGSATLQLARGAVEHLYFPLSSARRVLLSVTDERGMALSRGAVVVDTEGDFVALVQQDGQVFLGNHDPNRVLWVERPEQPRCQLVYELPAQADARHFEKAGATCLENRGGP